MFIPPDVTIASSIGLVPFMLILKCFNSFTNFCLSCLVISFIFLLPFIFVFSIMTGINFCGNNLSKLFLNCLFFCSSKSRNILASSFSSDKAGFKSISNSTLPPFRICSMFFVFTKYDEADNTIGPDTPK